MIAEADLSLTRTRNPIEIAELLRRDYYDAPICYFSVRLINAAANWLASSPEVFFLTAEMGDKQIGFVLGHSHGPKLWRRFARRHFYLAPWLAWYFFARCFGIKQGGACFVGNHRPEERHVQATHAHVATINEPFAWSPPGAHTGYVELIHVNHKFRGRGLASKLLRAVANEMCSSGIRRIEAHIDSENYSSVAAFQKSGWQVLRTGTGDYLASATI